jgi:hypothetical protein
VKLYQSDQVIIRGTYSLVSRACAIEASLAKQCILASHARDHRASARLPAAEESGGD